MGQVTGDINAKRGRVGHVFQGRFNSVLIDGDGSWLLLASEYLHLNPVRTSAMGLGKQANKAERQGLVEPTDEEVSKRLDKLRKYEWSSYRAYAGYEQAPEWLITKRMLARSRGRERYRKGVQAYITRGADPEQFERLRGRVAIGAVSFVEGAKKLVGKVTKEQPDRSFAARLVSFEHIVEIVERQTGKKWEEFRTMYRDPGRDLVLYLARMRSGLTLAQIGEKAGGLEYKTVGKAVKRFEVRM